VKRSESLRGMEPRNLIHAMASTVQDLYEVAPSEMLVKFRYIINLLVSLDTNLKSNSKNGPYL
jgi:hypothetical protein